MMSSLQRALKPEARRGSGFRENVASDFVDSFVLFEVRLVQIPDRLFGLNSKLVQALNCSLA